MTRSSEAPDDFAALVRSIVETTVRKRFGPEVSTPALTYHRRGGKALRTQLVHDFALGYGCDLDKASKVAAVTELFHTFALIHDDIEDSARTRRGGPSLHVQYGVPIAVNAGDALFSASWSCLSECAFETREKSTALLRLFADSLAKTIGGQGRELAWVYERQWDISWNELREMIVGKTSWYSAVFPTLAIAELLSLPAKERARIAAFAEKLGLVYQLVDDLRPYTGCTDGKDVMSDLVEGKRTLVVLLALKLLPPDKRDFLRSALEHGSALRAPDRLESVLNVIRGSKSVQHASAIIRREGEDCIASLRELAIAPAQLRVLESRVVELLSQVPPPEARPEEVAQPGAKGWPLETGSAVMSASG
jgi:geranylgeranyl pyrophosphate synthase